MGRGTKASRLLVGTAAIVVVAAALVCTGCEEKGGFQVVSAPQVTSETRTKVGARVVAAAVTMYMHQYGVWPEGGGTQVLVDAELLDGPGPEVDGWGREYVIRMPGEKNPDGFDVVSYGRDGVPGGTGHDEDVVVP